MSEDNMRDEEKREAGASALAALLMRQDLKPLTAQPGEPRAQQDIENETFIANLISSGVRTLAVY